MARSIQKLKITDTVEELDGKLAFQHIDDKLMHSVLKNDKEVIDNGKLILDAVNKGIGSFVPDMMFEQLVKNYSMAKKIYGEKIIRFLAGYDPDYLKKNIKIPEFQRIVKKNFSENFRDLQRKELLGDDGTISEKGFELASIELYMEELDNLMSKGFIGEKTSKKKYIYGDVQDSRSYKTSDRYRDIAIKKSVKLALRRSHKKLEKEDLKVFERKSKGQVYIIFCLDASSSMKGKKIELCKKAGVALAYKALNEQDKVGLVVFGSEVRTALEPTNKFTELLKNITKIRALQQTNIVKSIKKAVELFPKEHITRHLILLTDVLPTEGKEPESETLEAVSAAKGNGITISLVGIDLDNKGAKLAEKIVEIGEGRFYVVKNLEELDKIILEEYSKIV